MERIEKKCTMWSELKKNGAKSKSAKKKSRTCKKREPFPQNFFSLTPTDKFRGAPSVANPASKKVATHSTAFNIK